MNPFMVSSKLKKNVTESLNNESTGDVYGARYKSL
jgi:hypothetical protein